MRREFLAVSLLIPVAVGLAGCGARAKPAAPPPVFPLLTVWVAPATEGNLLPPLVTDGLRLFAATDDGSVRGIDLASGTLLWRLTGRPGRLGFGTGVLALRQADGTVWNLDPETGSTRWQASTGVAGDLPPIVDATGIVIAGAGLALLDSGTGRVVWASPGAPTSTTPPLVTARWVFTGESDGSFRCRDRTSGRLLWTRRLAKAVLAPAVIDDKDRVLLGTTDHRFVALRAAKGSQRWRWKLGADVRSPAAVFQDKVLLASYEAVLYALKRSSGHLVWRTPLPSRPLSSPILIGDAVLVACHENDLVGFAAKTGKKLGAFKTPALIQAPPIVVGDRVFVGLRDRSLLALSLARLTQGQEP